MSEQNHRVLYADRGVVALESCPLPVPAAGQLLIRTTASLISPGTERAWFLGLANTPATYPQTAGYSNVGQVVQVGAGVTGWQVGDRAASAAHHAAYVAVNAAECVPVPAGLADEEAAFFNLASIALQGVRKARVELGEPVVVIGGGLIGLMAVQLARLSGALPAMVVDKNPGRLEFAELIGADAVLYRDVHKKGLVLLGAHNNARPRVDSAPGWWTQRDDQRTALALLAARRLAVQPLITHRFAWRAAATAYDLLKQWDLNALGMVLNWQP